MNNPIIIVFAHDDYQAMFDMNLPFWESHDAPIHVLCPIGRPVKTKHHVLQIGAIGSRGPQMIERYYQAMVDALLKPEKHSHFVFFECDAICITKELPLKNGRWGNTFKNVHNGYGHHQEEWVTWQYLNFPWVIDRDSLNAFVEKANEYPDVIEQGYVDRWVAVIAQAAGIPMVRFFPRGFTRIQISKACDPGFMDELSVVVKDGGTMFHGVKTKDDLDLILNMRKFHGL